MEVGRAWGDCPLEFDRVASVECLPKSTQLTITASGLSIGALGSRAIPEEMARERLGFCFDSR